VPQGRIRGLDGLRAISIILVLVHHLGDPWSWSVYGKFGVQVFFVISGFLITWLLCLEEDKYGSISLAAFYVRRSLRILPPAFVCLLAVQVLGWYGLADVHPNDFLHAALFVGNMTKSGDHMGHFWSLAIEEQFYLMWPLLFLLLATNGRRLVFLAGLFLFWVPWYHFRVTRTVMSGSAFDLHAEYLIAGCVLALARRDERILRTLNTRFLQMLAVPLLSVAAICYFKSPLFHVDSLIHPGCAIGVLLIINYAVESSGGFLNWRPLVWLGNLSYSLYLWQQVFCWHSQLGWLGHFPQNLLASLALASMSFYLLEQPLARLRRRVPHIPNRALLRLRDSPDRNLRTAD
jgi:peptidoglycan/LPS O-acetylase OafA/YrhL